MDTSGLDAKIQEEIAGLSEDEFRQELAKYKERRAKRKESSAKNAEARKKYYEEHKDTPEWKAARQAQAAKRKAKELAIIAMAKEKCTPEELAELGIS
jgi:hypothetical protein